MGLGLWGWEGQQGAAHTQHIAAGCHRLEGAVLIMLTPLPHPLQCWRLAACCRLDGGYPLASCGQAAQPSMCGTSPRTRWVLALLVASSRPTNSLLTHPSGSSRMQACTHPPEPTHTHQHESSAGCV